MLCGALTGCQPAPLLNYPEGFREFAYVANRAGNTVTVLDLVYLRVDRTVAVGTTPVALAVNPTKDEVYAVNEGSSSVSVIDTASNKVRATVPVRRDPIALAVDPTGSRAYVLSQAAAAVTVLDLTTDKTIATIPTGPGPDGLALAPDGRSLVVANAGNGSVSVYAAAIPQTAAPHANDLPAPSPVGTPALSLRATFTGCPGARSPVIPRGSAKAFIACTDSNQVLALSLAADPANKPDPALLTDHAVALLDVGRHPDVLTAKPDGGEIFASNRDADSISEISTQTNEVESTYTIGNRPTHAIISGDNSELWVANNGASSLSLYSIDDGKLLPSVRTGAAPDALAFSADQILLLAADSGSGDVAVVRTTAQPGPGLLTILPAGSQPCAIVVKAMPAKP